MRDRLIELQKQAKLICSETNCKDCVGYGQGWHCFHHLLADHLLANGVIVPPCKVGDTVYYLDEECYYVCEYKVVGLTLSDEHGPYFFLGNHLVEFLDPFDENDLGKTVFLTREEAEQALKGENHDG